MKPLFGLFFLFLSGVGLTLCPPAGADPLSPGGGEVKAAEAVFRRFTTLLLTGPHDQAQLLALGAARERVARLGGEPVTPKSGDTIIVQSVLDKTGSVVRILATQVVQDRAVANAPPVFHRQNATLTLTAEGWRVSAFDDQLEACCQ